MPLGEIVGGIVELAIGGEENGIITMIGEGIGAGIDVIGKAKKVYDENKDRKKWKMDSKEERKKDNERKEEKHDLEMQLLKIQVEKEKLQVEEERTIKQDQIRIQHESNLRMQEERMQEANRRVLAANSQAPDAFEKKKLYNYVRNTDVEGARRAIQAGADVEKGDDWNTPLFRAVIKEHLGLVNLLLSKGANPNHASGVTGDNNKPLNRPPLVTAAKKGNLAICRALINHGANIHAKDGAGADALYAAAREGHTEVCRLLLSHNANVHATNAKGRDALFEAILNKHQSVCTLLIQHGANKHRMIEGWTADGLAKRFGFTL